MTLFEPKWTSAYMMTTYAGGWYGRKRLSNTAVSNNEEVGNNLGVDRSTVQLHFV